MMNKNALAVDLLLTMTRISNVHASGVSNCPIV
jgi:hypothetical protein